MRRRYLVQAFMFITLCLMMCSQNCMASRPNFNRVEHHEIEDPTSTAMLNFYKALSKTLAKDAEMPITRIIHYGDSHIAADIMTAALRAKFQRDFGDAGIGFIPACKPWSWYLRAGMKQTATTGWSLEGLGTPPFQDPLLGLYGLSCSTDFVGQTFTITAESSAFKIYTLKQPEGGTVEVFLDGVKTGRRVSLRSETVEPTYINIKANTNSTHTLELKTVRPGKVKIFGLSTEKNQPGVTYTPLGINGARVSRFNFWDWSILAESLTEFSPNLILLSYGSNEVTDPDLDLEEYERNFSEILKRFREAAPDASILVISPPDRAMLRGRVWQTVSRMALLVEAQRRAALSNGAAFWNLYNVMGGAGSIDKWTKYREPFAQPDHVHLTRTGYRYVADILYQEMIRNYFKYIFKFILADRK